jgi:hypothetical protein
MPTVFIKGGYRFFFSWDIHEPMHIHFEKDDSYAKFWLEPIALAHARRFRSHQLTEIRKLIEKNKKIIKGKWYEHFGL